MRTQLELTANEEITLVPGAQRPDVSVSVVERMDGWFAALNCFANSGFLDGFHGPYSSREAAFRNAVCFGLHGMVARRQPKRLMCAVVDAAFGEISPVCFCPGVKAAVTAHHGLREGAAS